MENKKQGKLKLWSESYKPEPGSAIWQRIESRLAQEPTKRKGSIFTLTIVRIAAIFVFMVVSITIFNTFFSSRTNLYSMGKTMDLSPLNLDDVSVYYEPEKVKDLKNAYSKINNH